MSLFQQSVLTKYLNHLDTALIDQKYKKFQDYFGNVEIQKNIRNAKEEQFQEGFLYQLFVSIFGYTLNPQPNYNLTTELKNVLNSRKVDGAILRDGDALAVIELKGTDTTDLDSIESQAFGYKNHNAKCAYVITSNFEKLRFYIQNAVDHIDFDLFHLSREEFSLIWICLASDNLLNDLPLRIKESSEVQQQNITKELYADYSKFRTALYTNLVENNPDTDKLLLFNKTQKLLDRFLFILFAEDRVLLPPNSISKIVKQWTTLRDLDAYVPLYDRFKKFFGYMNTGYKGKKYDIFAYNGGLFLPDEILDSISIDDDILHEHTMKLSSYDFETDVDVNILGHIFEHSLGEIESVQAEIKGEKVDAQKTKRKKDGIFYTPKYITKYIVDNTIGKLCLEKRDELGIVDEEFARGRKNRRKDTIKTLDDKLTDYRTWLLSLTILDPACGSGAFLNQALDFLITEHHKIDDLKAQLFGSALVFADIATDILEKNIYGVDLNGESIEIAKLSLWLRTAQKGRKLNRLNNNIKCGNSLIDDPEVAGDKAFNWQEEFPAVFAKGGFDVVIGNPPYVQSSSNELERDYFITNYYSNEGKPDLYRLFIEKGISLLNNNGKFSFITPNSFLTIPSAKKLRSFIKKETALIQIINFEGMVFKDASVNTVIFIIDRKKSNNEISIVNDVSLNPSALSLSSALANQNSISFDDYKSSDTINVVYSDPKIKKLIEKINESSDNLSLISKYTLGLQVYHNTLHSSEDIKGRVYHSKNKLDPSYMPEIGGKDLSRYLVSLQNPEYVSLGEWCYNKPDSFFLTGKRIFIREIPSPTHLIAAFFEEEGVPNKAVIIVRSEEFNMYSLLGIINSRLIGFYIHKTTEKGKQKLFPRISLTSIRNLPISKKENTSFPLKVEEHLNKVLLFKKQIDFVLSLLINKFMISKPSRKLQNWSDLDFSDFLKELEKARKKAAKENDRGYKKLSLSEEAEWMQYFNDQKEKTLIIKSEIEKTDKEIDQMVYELYGLTEEEIAIVENS